VSPVVLGAFSILFKCLMSVKFEILKLKKRRNKKAPSKIS
jgi:hypothetical protein